MKTVALISQKGGAGKTTLAAGLAVAGERAGLTTVLLDLDPQASAAKWGALRRRGDPCRLMASKRKWSSSVDSCFPC